MIAAQMATLPVGVRADYAAAPNGASVTGVDGPELAQPVVSDHALAQALGGGVAQSIATHGTGPVPKAPALEDIDEAEHERLMLAGGHEPGPGLDATLEAQWRDGIEPAPALSQPQAAELMNVSRRSVQRASEVRREDPELADEVAAGTMSLAEAQRRVAHVSHNSGNNEWYTPRTFIDAAREVMGGIDLDPASSDIANQTVGATRYFTEEINGLEQDWGGRVWMNPPYAQPAISEFITKVVSENIDEAIVLVNNGTETRWGQELGKASSAVCFPAKRIKFLDPEGNPSGAPLQGQMIAYIGDRPAVFVEVFRQFGWVTLTADLEGAEACA